MHKSYQAPELDLVECLSEAFLCNSVEGVGNEDYTTVPGDPWDE